MSSGGQGAVIGQRLVAGLAVLHFDRLVTSVT
jgi:hypothetical protein